MNEFDFETPSDVVSSEALSLGTRKPVAKPDISSLPDAIVGGIAQFSTGDKLVIERYASFLKDRPYLDTKTFRVVSMDEFTGRIHLFDEALDQNAIMNWKEAVRYGTVFKLAVGKVDISTKKKRGRPRKNPIEVEKPAVDPSAPKRGRGRPAGAKNRPKEVIAAEKAAMKAKRAEKAKKKVAKKKVSTVVVAAPAKTTKKVAKKTKAVKVAKKKRSAA